VEANATVKYVRSAPQKARLVVDEVRGKNVGEALSLLQFSIKKKVARDVAKLIKSAVANVESKNPDAAVDVDDMFISKICVNEGPVLKRFRARAQGRVGRILKRTCHISVTVES